MGDAIQQVYPDFDKEKFIHLTHDGTWETKELKGKMRHIARCLHETLPKDYPEALEILTRIAPSFRSFDAMVFPDYVECYGLDDWDLSLPALAFFTKYASSEFAIRPFLARDPERAIATMRVWAEDEDPPVRRLASEGCRPRLPWAMAAAPMVTLAPATIVPVFSLITTTAEISGRTLVVSTLAMKLTMSWGH